MWQLFWFLYVCLVKNLQISAVLKQTENFSQEYKVLILNWDYHHKPSPPNTSLPGCHCDYLLCLANFCEGIAGNDGYGAFLPPPAWLSNPHCMPSSPCTAGHAAEPEAKVLNIAPAYIAGLDSSSGMYYEKLHNSRCQLH